MSMLRAADTRAGQTCQNGNVQCQQTVICCNNFNGVSLFFPSLLIFEWGKRAVANTWRQFQFCMGDIDFNIPITINMNLGGGRGGKKNP